jgi:molecular chaperone GrpE (heat shock protein)
MNENFAKIEAEITQIKQENIRLKNSLEDASLEQERQIDALILEVIQVIDAYDKAETVVKDRGYNDDETAGKAIKRMLQPKKISLSILSKYNVSQIDLDGKIINEDLCSVVDTEPDSTKEDGLVVSVEKNGYVRGDRLIRRAEVIIIKN